MKNQNKFRMNVAGRIVKDLLDMDLNLPYDHTAFNQNERRTYAGNIYSALREYKKVCKNDENSVQLLSGILGIEIEDLETKTLAISRGMTEDEARELSRDLTY